MPQPITRRAALERLSLLVGGAISAPIASGLMAGCRAAPDPDYTPRSLSAAQYDLTGTLADLIIPETDTPGATGAGVPVFVDQLMTEWYPAEDRERFLSDLNRVNALAQESYGVPFAELDEGQQFALAALLDEEAFGPAPVEYTHDLADAAGTQAGTDDLRRIRQLQLADDEPTQQPFFRMFKELVLTGYYTSEVGATQELHINPMGTYQGDVPFSEVGKAWA